MPQIKLEINPFDVPKSVSLKLPVGKRQDGFAKPTSIHLSELDDETLHQLCDDFIINVYKIAKKELVRFNKHGRVEVIFDGKIIAEQG